MIEKYPKDSRRFSNLKQRAKKKNIDWSLSFEDWINLERPKRCPLLNIELNYTNNKIKSNSPSLDRIDNTKGYTLDNVWFVSNRANSIKNSASVGELLMIALNLRKKIRNV